LIQSPSASIPLGIVVLILIGGLAAAMILGAWVAWRLAARAPRKPASPPIPPPALLAAPSLADVLNALPFPAALVSLDGYPRVVNDQAATAWLVASSPPRLSAPLVTLAQRVAADGAAETVSVAIGPEGEQLTTRVRAVPLLGRRHPYAGTARDGVLLVGQIGSEAGLNLTRVVAHELRTPLTAIVGHAEILESCSPADEALWRRSRDFIAAETQRLARLVDDLLALSRLEAAPLLRAARPRRRRPAGTGPDQPAGQRRQIHAGRRDGGGPADLRGRLRASRGQRYRPRHLPRRPASPLRTTLPRRERASPARHRPGADHRARHPRPA
jgi:signal transduction histidine kinase